MTGSVRFGRSARLAVDGCWDAFSVPALALGALPQQ